MGGEHDLWIEDLAELKTLGRAKIRNVSEDLSNAANMIPGLRMDPSVFGEGSQVAGEIVGKYDRSRDTLKRKVDESATRTDAVANAVVEIANHYENVDRQMS